MKTFPLFHVDAFTNQPFAGNPAAVCVLQAWPEASGAAGWLQAVAGEMNLSETAFLVPGSRSQTEFGNEGSTAFLVPGSRSQTEFGNEGSTAFLVQGGNSSPRSQTEFGNEGSRSQTEFGNEGSSEGATFELRWFTPKVEVDLCGHATLASAHVLWEAGLVGPEEAIAFRTNSGLLTAVRRDGLIELDFPLEPEEESSPPAALIEALGVRPKYVGRNRFDWLLEADSEAVLRGLKPDFARLAAVTDRGVIVTSVSSEPRFDFVSRFFAPAAGIDEDPVTGSAHCCLGAYWRKRLGKSELVAYQASARGGVVHVRVTDNRAYLSGQAVLVARGELVAG